MQDEALERARSREANLIFVLPSNVYVGPAPVGGTFWFQIFILIGGVTAIVSYRPGG